MNNLSKFDKLANHINIEILSFKNCVLARYHITDETKYKRFSYNHNIIGKDYAEVSKKIKKTFYKLSYVNPIRVLLGLVVSLAAIVLFGSFAYFGIIENNFLMVIIGIALPIGFLYSMISVLKDTFKFWKVIYSTTNITRDRIDQMITRFSSDFDDDTIKNARNIELLIENKQ